MGAELGPFSFSGRVEMETVEMETMEMGRVVDGIVNGHGWCFEDVVGVRDVVRDANGRGIGSAGMPATKIGYLHEHPPNSPNLRGRGARGCSWSVVLPGEDCAAYVLV